MTADTAPPHRVQANGTRKGEARTSTAKAGGTRTDAGLADAGLADAGLADAGPIDARLADAGPTDMARNLRHLCTERRSVSELCRQIGFNRQQFARYLNGTSRPSPHNLRRIAAHFGLDAAALALPHDRFVAEIRPSRVMPGGAQALPLVIGDPRGLRPFLGAWHSHYRTPSAPGQIMRALVVLSEESGRVVSRTIERSTHDETAQISRARFNGVVSIHDGAIFLVEWGRISRGGVAETILVPSHRGSRNWLNGHLLSFSWRSRRPYTSPCVWKRLPRGMALREAIGQCGSFSARSGAIDRLAAQVLGEDGSGEVGGSGG